MPIEWDALFIAYREQTGRWPERVYLHPEDYRRTVEHLAATLREMPLTAVDTALWGVPATVTEWVPDGMPLLWPPPGIAEAHTIIQPPISLTEFAARLRQEFEQSLNQRWAGVPLAGRRNGHGEG